MDYVFYAIAFIGLLIVSAMVFEYWQNRSWGLPHHASLGESAVAGTFLSFLACADLIIANVVY